MLTSKSIFFFGCILASAALWFIGGFYSGRDIDHRKTFLRSRIIRGHPQLKEVALTIDDGPHPKYTRALLDILKKYNVKATFFVVGKMARKHPELMEAIVREGHLLANHTFNHINLTKASAEKTQRELFQCNKFIDSISGKVAYYFRPPGGNYNHKTVEVVQKMGMKMVLWTNNPGDYASPGADQLACRILREIQNGEVILIHDGVRDTLKALPRVLEEVQQKGFKFVMIDQFDVNRKRYMDSIWPSS